MFSFESVHDIFAAADEGLTVMQTSQDHRDPMVVARALSHVCGLPVIDVAATVRKHHGPVVLENLRPEVAQPLVDQLQQAGIPVQAVMARRLPVARFLGTVDRLDYQHGHLGVVAHHHKAEIPWEAVALISIAWVEMHKVEKEFLAGEKSYDMRGMEHTGDIQVRDKKVAEKHLVADLFYALPDGCSYVRLMARHMPYAHLGDRLQPSSQDNFRTVLHDLVDRCPDCQLNDNCRKFLAGEGLPMKDIYHSVESFDEENLKLLKLPY